MSSNNRLKAIKGHLGKPKQIAVSPGECSADRDSGQVSASPGRRELLKWNGWGFRDSKFVIRDGLARFTGTRYILGGHTFPKLVEWFIKECHADLSKESLSQPVPDPASLPKPLLNQPFLDSIKNGGVQFTLDPHARLFHGHGHTCHEVFELRHGTLHRIPDIVIWPNCHTDVERIVKQAVEHDVCIIPFGGGTSVSNALECPVTEERMIVSLDMTEMKKILWVDDENLVAHIEAGIIGQELERQVN